MAWVRLDDHFDEHPKLARVGPLGLALFVTGLAYCNRNLTDGHIPWSTARSLLPWEFLAPPTADGRRLRYTIGVTSGMHGDDVDGAFVIALLVDAGLWEEEEDGYRVHDYADYQPTRAEVEANVKQINEVRAAAGRRGGLRSAEVRRERSKNGVVHSQTPSKPEANAKANIEAKAKQNSTPVPNPNPVTTTEPLLDRSAEPADIQTALMRARAFAVPKPGLPPGSPQVAIARAFAAAVGCEEPSTPSERRKWQPAITEMIHAGVTADEVAGLVSAFLERNTVTCTPQGVAGQLGQLRSPARAPPRQNGHHADDELSVIDVAAARATARLNGRMR